MIVVPDHAGVRLSLSARSWRRAVAGAALLVTVEPVISAGPGWASASPGLVTCTKQRGIFPSPSTVQKKSRASSCLLSTSSRGEFAGASIRFVSHAIS